MVPYASDVDTVLVRFLTIVAFVLMPFGMASATSASQPADGVQVNSLEQHLGHCNPQPSGDESDDQNGSAPSSDCSSMCTVIPASEILTPVRVVQLRSPSAHILANPFTGIEPDITTPPPRRA